MRRDAAICSLLSMLNTICDFLDDFLKIKEIEDYPHALNGLQLENDGRVTKVGAAVDASEVTIELAIKENVDLLVVHHGLFWGGLNRITGAYHRKLRVSIAANLAVYSAHLPLDLHTEVGNNILLANALHLPVVEPLSYNTERLGVSVSTELDFRELVNRLRGVLGRDPWVCASGPEKVRHVGIVTGAAGNLLQKVVAQGIDTFVTGEGPHHTFALAEELRVNLVYGGHYATETFGVRALAAKVAARFDLPWCFVDHPSGL
jgi:dinuclear metal center YbgI/SA1388 family protein